MKKKTTKRRPRSTKGCDARLAPQGFNFVSGTPDDLRKYMQAEMAKWRDVISKAGIKLD